MIARYMIALCSLSDIGVHDVSVKCGAQAFRADTIRTNVTKPGQAFIQQITLGARERPQRKGHDQLVGEEMDAWVFSLAADELMRAEWFRARGISEAQWLAQVEAQAKVIEDLVRREEAGEKVDWGTAPREVGGPPGTPRLDLMTVTLGDEMRIKVRYVDKIPEGRFNVLLFGAADMGVGGL